MSLLRVLVGVINRAGTTAKALGLPVERLSPAALEQAAARREGHDDFGDPGYRAGLDALVESIEADANLHTVARLHMRELLTELLVSRLRLARLPASTPTPLVAPLIVCGLPRSGTTFLHRMLAERDDARALPLWELREPIRGPGPDRRLAAARARDARLVALAGARMDAQHLMRAELPDECGHLLKISMYSSLFWQVPVHGYLEWYLEADGAQPYREYRALLAVLAHPGQRLVLKDPFHAAQLPSLLAVLPEAMVVQTHRDPVEVVPSFNKLTTSFQALLSDDFDRARSVTLNLRWLQTVVRRNHEARAALAPGRLLDVRYGELLRDPFAVVDRVHAHFGLELDGAYADRLRRFIGENPQRKHGPNPYAAADYGQTTAAIAAAFADYRARFSWA
jgi:hypothetical protein